MSRPAPKRKPAVFQANSSPWYGTLEVSAIFFFFGLVKNECNHACIE